MEKPVDLLLPDLERDLEDVGLDKLDELYGRGARVIDHMRQRVFSPGTTKTLELRFNMRQAVKLVGRSESAIRDAQNDGRLPKPEADPDTKRRAIYTLEDINEMRRVFKTLPWRRDWEEPVILAIQNFKGGAGKTTVACHLAQHLALRGYRVCIIDCDSQASTTSMFGLNPDVDVDEERETLYPFFRIQGAPETLDYALVPTYWPGITLIPANLALYHTEYEFAALIRGHGAAILDRLRQGIDTIKDRFDIIIMDPPPALGMMSLSVMRAANALIIPAPPGNIDFASTVHFLKMLANTSRQIAEFLGERRYKFVKVLVTKLNESKKTHIGIKKMMDAVFPADMLSAVLKDSAEIDNSTVSLRTVYETTGPDARTETHRRCRASLDEVCQEIELLIRRTWPSHLDQLEAEMADRGEK